MSFSFFTFNFAAFRWTPSSPIDHLLSASHNHIWIYQWNVRIKYNKLIYIRFKRWANCWSKFGGIFAGGWIFDCWHKSSRRNLPHLSIWKFVHYIENGKNR